MDDHRSATGWYPGKYLRRQSVARSNSKEVDTDTRECSEHENSDIGHQSPQNEKDGWYPGKYISKKLSLGKSGTSHEEEDPCKNKVRRLSKSSPCHSDDEMDNKDAPKPISASKIKDGARKLLSENDEIFEKPKKTSPSKPVYGKVRVTLHSIKYFNFGRASVLVELDDKHSFYDLSAGSQSYMEDVAIDFTTELGMSYFPSDVIITLNGKPTASTKGGTSESVNNVGVAILPLMRYTTIFGLPMKASPEWVILFPAKFGRSTRKKFVSGFSDLPGYAMNKCKDPVGFLKVSVEIIELQNSKNVMSLYFIAEPHHYNIHTVDSTEQEDSLQITTIIADESDQLSTGDNNACLDAVSVAVCNRDLQRLRRVLLSPPLIFASFFSLPKVFVLIAFSGYLVYTASTHHIPFLLVLALLLNGILSKTNRSFSHVIVWNDPNAPESASVSKSAMTIQRSWNAILSTLSFTVRFLEVGVNLLGFADVRMSIMTYSFLQAIAVLSSLLIILLGFRFFIISTFSVSLLTWVVHDIVFEFVEHKAKNPLPAEQAAVLMKYVLMAKWAMRMLDNFFAKVPDDLEMTHRYICQLQLTKEKGVEMVEAGVEFKAAKK